MSRQSEDTFPIDQVGEADARRLLALCGARAASPMDRLADHLRGGNGKSWVIGVLASIDVGGIEASRVVLEGAGGLQAAERLRGLAKKTMGADEAGDSDRRAALLYLASAAAARAHHGVRIGSRAPDELARHLVSLEASLPHELGAVFRKAADGFASDAAGR